MLMQNLIVLRLWPFCFQNQMIVTESIESFNCSSRIFLAMKMNVSKSFAEAGVLVFCQIHLWFSSEFVRKFLQIGIGSWFWEIGNSNCSGVVSSALACSILLLILDKWRNVLARLAHCARFSGRCRCSRLCVENFLNVCRCMTIWTICREMTSITETTLGKLICE